MHCDRREPGCEKCEQKRIKCSGLGVRYRFRDDTHKKFAQGRIGGYRKFQPIEDTGDLNINSYERVTNDADLLSESDDQLKYHELPDDNADMAIAPFLEPVGPQDLDFLDDTPLFETALVSPGRVFDPVEGWQQFLFTHCEHSFPKIHT